jgi:hypothetical protein
LTGTRRARPGAAARSWICSRTATEPDSEDRPNQK